MPPFARSVLGAAILLTLGAPAPAQEPAPPVPVPVPAPSTPDNPAAAAAAALTQQQSTVNPLAALAAAVSAPRPYAELIRGASHHPGFLPLYRKEEKVWMEVRPEQLDKPFFLSLNIANGIGERGVYGGQMAGSQVVYFHRMGNVIQLIARNTEFAAKAGTPQAQVVAESYSDSLLAAAPVASAPHPQTKGFLIEANTLLFTDIPAFSPLLERAFRMNYAFDVRNSSFASVRADAGMTGLLLKAHYYAPRISAPPANPLLPQASPPATLPDPRSMFLGLYYSFMPLPEQPMPARLADDRIGHFVTTTQDYSDDVAPTTAVHAVNRWRLEKKDPAQALSEPKQPIVYWLDKNIPEKYRKSVQAGILAWNAAFERLGYQNAIVVRQQGPDDKFDTMDARHASVRWFVGADAAFAIGPSQVDPRSGEILDADIAISDVFARSARRMVGDDVLQPPKPQAAMPLLFGQQANHEAHCDYMLESAQEMGFAMDLLEARGEFDMGSPQADAVAQAYVTSLVMHEVGHTLGLRHNFRSSTAYSAKQLQDVAFTRKNGLTGSVMDYTPFNLAVKGEQQGEYVSSVLGPYDYWAIEYAYQTIAPEREKQELARIAGRSHEPLLAFGTEQDMGLVGADPDVNVFDLGSDPLAYFQKRLAISRELWDRAQTRQLKPGESYDALRRSFDYGFGQFARTLPVVVKYVGGMTYLRDHAGTGRATFTPVPLARQRAALQMLTRSLFTADSFKFSPAMLSRLSPDRFESHGRADVSVRGRVLSLQSAVLDLLMSDAVAARVMDAREKVADSRGTLGLDELYGTLQNAVWSELKTGKEISPMRRNLQREHLTRMLAVLVRSLPATPADARSLQRQYALQLRDQLRVARGRAGSRVARAHLAESYDALDQALKAPMLRLGV